MKVLDAVPQGRVLDAITIDGTDIVALAKRCVDQTISEMSDEALHDMLKRWQKRQQTKR